MDLRWPNGKSQRIRDLLHKDSQNNLQFHDVLTQPQSQRRFERRCNITKPVIQKQNGFLILTSSSSDLVCAVSVKQLKLDKDAQHMIRQVRNNGSEI